MFRQNRYLLVATFIVWLMALSPACKKESKPSSYPYTFSFLTEEYEPFNYTENDVLTGLAPELLKRICGELEIPFGVTVLPWDQAYTTALNTGNAVLFSTVLNEERKDLFKWAGPIASLDWIFYSVAGSTIRISSLEEAKGIGKIGVVPDYAITQYLEGQGFTNLVYCTNHIGAFDKLLKGEIDLFPSDRLTAEAALGNLGKSIYSVAERLTIRTDLVYFAFNRNVPDNVVADFQRQIDLLKENGVMASLCRTFLNTSDFPGSFQIYTENYPPLTFRDAYGDITGFGTEVVREIMKKNGFYADITLTLWSIGYDLALINPNFCLFTMDRTEIRDTLFQWVGPLGTNTTYFYIQNGSGVVINTLDDAKNLTTVGTVSSWFSDQYLRSLGFSNLVSGSDPIEQTRKLMNGEIQAFVCTSITFPDILIEAGFGISQVTPAFALMSSDYYIAFSKNTSPSIVEDWQKALDELKNDGTYEEIYRRWFLLE
ncbi:MAG: transporter substrate-binding domain-containing protein [Bacteroidales bacterium]|nr:transporter substrate-binding domain-containing protein [Bacteroidales bacterium]